jgi:hypothetical protein
MAEDSQGVLITVVLTQIFTGALVKSQMTSELMRML